MKKPMNHRAAVAYLRRRFEHRANDQSLSSVLWLRYCDQFVCAMMGTARDEGEHYSPVDILDRLAMGDDPGCTTTGSTIVDHFFSAGEDAISFLFGMNNRQIWEFVFHSTFPNSPES